MTRLVRLGRRWADAVRWDTLAGIVGAVVLLGALLALIVFLNRPISFGRRFTSPSPPTSDLSDRSNWLVDRWPEATP